ncbi:hypothetical protein LH410_15925 [Yersinia intermedia]|nr:hypothetical protein [Yersinia intermedia]MCB5312164.1 hypothetical protein [Yersinia intermedia]MCB5320915.1 hypothetical protein [Yersinia intermedia]MCB5326090.1 hypothetical protein [Yersinia intermedia]
MRLNSKFICKYCYKTIVNISNYILAING